MICDLLYSINPNSAPPIFNGSGSGIFYKFKDKKSAKERVMLESL